MHFGLFLERVHRLGVAGFPFKELLVVIAIILLLLALLLPSLQTVRRRCLRVACANHLYGFDPDGASQGFMDGSVRWTPFAEIRARFRSGDFQLFL